jgi:putative addiction module component (TIGR02574 family)
MGETSRIAREEERTMPRSAGCLLEVALRLPEGERAELAARVIDSLDPQVDDDAEAAWEVEVKQRLEQIDQGRVSLVPWHEAVGACTSTCGGALSAS